MNEKIRVKTRKKEYKGNILQKDEENIRFKYNDDYDETTAILHIDEDMLEKPDNPERPPERVVEYNIR